MPPILNILRRRDRRRSRSGRSISRHAGRFLIFSGFLLSALLAVAFIAAALFYADLTRDLPNTAELPILLNEEDGLLLEPTRFYDRTGNELLTVIAPRDEARTYTPYDHLPKALIDATLALADPGFWEHGGYRLEGWQDAGSHPTIAQRLAADLLLWDEMPTPRRGLRERMLAAQITSQYGREQVLEWYLNSADYGNAAYGVDAAARLYLGKPASVLDLGESALLAAVSQAPALNPFDAPESAEQLRLEALQEMVVQGLLSAQEASTAVFDPPAIRTVPVEAPTDRTAFVNLALEQLGQKFDEARIRRGGLVVLTTYDQDLQAQTACALKNELAHLAGLVGDIPAEGEETCTAAQLLLPPDGTALMTDASASALILDPRSGQVLAVVGDVRTDSVSAYQQTHPAGTLLTPFIYLSGFSRGMGPASLGWDIPGGMTNFDGRYRGPVRLRTAMVNDLLPPAEALLAQLGTESVVNIASKFGLILPEGQGLLDDGIPLSLVDAAALYAVFADQGSLAGQSFRGDAIQPVTILRVSTVDGAVWADWSTPTVQAVVSPQLAYMMTDILSDENARQGVYADLALLDLDIPSAAKVGQSFDLRSAWAAGYTPQRVVVVHVSASDTPLVPAMDLWHALTVYAHRDLPAVDWVNPGGLTTLEVCDPSGLLPTDACPNIVKELFLAGNEPIQADTLYQAYQVNRETGLLATVYTPPELVEWDTYMIVPPEAKVWAEGMGLPVPPAEYDAIETPAVLPDVHITSPLLFAQVNGTLEIRGTAAGADFGSYHLDYGQGLNPHAWVQIGEESSTSVREGVLGTWDTSGLNGLVALRLVVVRTDMRLEQAVVMITITQP